MNGATATRNENTQVTAAHGRNDVERLRTLLIALLGFGMVGTGLELVLLEHTEDAFQWVPLVGLVLGLVGIVSILVRPDRVVVGLFRALMVLFIAAGGLGIFLHYRGNVEFELEMYPSMNGFELVWEALHGATPALAPGTMALFGLLGLLATYRHRALRSARTTVSPEEATI